MDAYGEGLKYSVGDECHKGSGQDASRCQVLQGWQGWQGWQGLATLFNKTCLTAREMFIIYQHVNLFSNCNSYGAEGVVGTANEECSSYGQERRAGRGTLPGMGRWGV